MGRPAPDFSNQVHDFNPGLDNGLFWTTPIDLRSVVVNPGSGKASLVVNNLQIGDYSNIVNALTGGPFNPATASFAVHWATGLKVLKVRDQAIGVAGEVVRNTATMTWAVETAGQSYVSGPENTSASVYAQIGHERNGVFYPQ